MFEKAALLASRAKAGDWTKPAAMAIPREGYFKLEQGRYGPIFPKTPTNYGFTLIAKIKPGREEHGLYCLGCCWALFAVLTVALIAIGLLITSGALQLPSRA
jgi:hypothetical protein